MNERKQNNMRHARHIIGHEGFFSIMLHDATIYRDSRNTHLRETLGSQVHVVMMEFGMVIYLQEAVSALGFKSHGPGARACMDTTLQMGCCIDHGNRVTDVYLGTYIHT